MITPLENGLSKALRDIGMPLSRPIWRNDLRNGVELDKHVLKGMYGMTDEEVEQDIASDLENLDVLDQGNFYTVMSRIAQSPRVRVVYSQLLKGEDHSAPDYYLRRQMHSAFKFGKGMEVIQVSHLSMDGDKIVLPMQTAPPATHGITPIVPILYDVQSIVETAIDFINNTRVDKPDDFGTEI